MKTNVPTKVKCPVCSGEIMKRFERVGYRPNIASHQGYHCSKCGIEFYQLPKSLKEVTK